MRAFGLLPSLILSSLLHLVVAADFFTSERTGHLLGTQHQNMGLITLSLQPRQRVQRALTTAPAAPAISPKAAPQSRPQKATPPANPQTLGQTTNGSSTSNPSGDPEGSSSAQGAQHQIRSLYLQELSQLIERHKFYPPLARRLNQQGRVEVSFEIASDGSFHAIRIARPSDHARLNQAAIEVIERIGRFKEIPAEIKSDRLTITSPINYELL